MSVTTRSRPRPEPGGSGQTSGEVLLPLRPTQDLRSSVNQRPGVQDEIDLRQDSRVKETGGGG